MVYRHYNLMLLLRFSLVVSFAIYLGISIQEKNAYSIGVSSFFLLLTIWEMIRFLNKTHKQMNYFVKAIKNDDTTLQFPKKSGNLIINELHQSLNELNSILQDVQVKSRIKEKYVGEILQNIATGVIVMSENKHITDVNTAALELLGLPTFTHISQLQRIDLRFANSLSEMQNKQRKVLELNAKKERIQMIIRCSVIRLENEDVKLITLQDIRGELERKEVDAWIKLIRVLSHEIMNSLAPVTSIAQSLKRIWEEQADAKSEQVYVEKTINGLGVITEMSEALIRFVQSYRVLSKAPKPILENIDAFAFFDRLNILLSPMRENFKGNLHVKHPQKNFQFCADEQMMIQIIINLVKNATEAFNPSDQEQEIVVLTQHKSHITEIIVKDNGPGIPEEMIDEIFIPFFTTKENGSGIGLSYSRQIVRAHGGSLFCRSKQGQTIFTIRF